MRMQLFFLLHLKDKAKKEVDLFLNKLCEISSVAQTCGASYLWILNLPILYLKIFFIW